jgi:hypothetical protein
MNKTSTAEEPLADRDCPQKTRKRKPYIKPRIERVILSPGEEETGRCRFSPNSNLHCIGVLWSHMMDDRP